MREWKLQSGDPLLLTLASDARLGPTDYANDQIWELTLGGGDPPALALQTTYGLRARALRLFPRFKEADISVNDPAEFSRPAVIHQIFTNFLVVSFSPIPGIDVIAEYWVPESSAVAGRMQLTNRAPQERQIQVEWISQLTPGTGARMAPFEMQAATILAGSTGDLAPVFFITGGPKPGAGSYPSLNLTYDIPAEGVRRFTWSQAALSDRESSFQLARRLVTANWDAERSRLEMLNAGHVEIYTGDPDWDATFMLAQKTALGLLVGPTEKLPNPSFVLTRQPDQGYSLRGDGSDYNHLWNGQSPLEAGYLISLILPIAPAVCQGLFRNYLAVQQEDGFIDWKPGMGGQRSRLLATPVLASLAWRIYEFTDDLPFLKEAYEPLSKFFWSWFATTHDRDQDGIPEWDHPMHAGLDDHPIYSQWHDLSPGVEISSAEGPGLCSFLYQECQALISMANILGQGEAIPALQETAVKLSSSVEAAWNETQASYFDWDRDTHFCTHGEWLGQRNGSGSLVLRQTFEHPIRVLVQLQCSEAARRMPVLFVHGTGAAGNPRVERITPEQFKWSGSLARMTGKLVYSVLDRVEVGGLEPDDQIVFSSATYDCQEQSLLLPLWAGIPDNERAGKLVEETITDPRRYWHPYGLPASLQTPQLPEDLLNNAVNFPWNALIGEGLVKYGKRLLAAELVQRQMNAAIQSLKREGAFRRYYHADSGQGFGERNALNGIAPVGLFLEVLGIRLISSNRVALAGTNPFPWPVTIKYRGLTILRERDKSTVTFPDGQMVEVNDPLPRIISLEMAKP